MRVLLPVSFLLALVSQGEIIDRVAIHVGDRVVTESLITTQIRLAAFQENRDPGYTVESKRSAAEAIIARILLIQEMNDSRYPEPPMSAVLVDLQEIIKERFGGSEEAYLAELKRRFIDEGDFRRFLQLQKRALEFIDIRFRTGAQVTQEEINSYYAKEFSTEWKKNSKMPVPPLEEAYASIEELLTMRKVDAALDEWVKQTRALTRIRFREEVFR